MTDTQNTVLIQKHLIQSMADLLQVSPDQIDPSSSFLSLGADSIVLIEAIRRVEESYGQRLSMQQLFEELDSIDSLSKYLSDHAAVGIDESKSISASESEKKSWGHAEEEVSAGRRERVENYFTENSTLVLFREQVQLVRETIEQQNNFLSGMPTSTQNKT